jgi:alkylation response protein AidB-like acyl-CoA dehydrogenase
MTLGSQVGWMQSRAIGLDQGGTYPAEEMEWLRSLGLWQPQPLDTLAETLMLIGQGNLSLGRIYEAHVNTLHLMACYGTKQQRAWAQSGGDAFALWVTDPPDGGVTMQFHGKRIRLTGAKQFCSGAGHATAALITAVEPGVGTRMLVVKLGCGERVMPLPAPLSGMRAAVTGAVDFTGCEAPADAILGEPDDYLREPVFSVGAWRGSAVACGGLIALVDTAIDQLRQSGRLESPHTQARIGQALIARETSRHWVATVARIGEDTTQTPGYRVATVGLGRIAVETACLDAMRQVQRSIGLSSFRHGSLVELQCRDLATYLRQPAPDEVLTASAAWFADHPTELT